MKLSRIIAGASAVVTSFGITVGVASAEKVLTVASWAAPFHVMNESVFPWIIFITLRTFVKFFFFMNCFYVNF